MRAGRKARDEARAGAQRASTASTSSTRPSGLCRARLRDAPRCRTSRTTAACRWARSTRSFPARPSCTARSSRSAARSCCAWSRGVAGRDMPRRATRSLALIEMLHRLLRRAPGVPAHAPPLRRRRGRSGPRSARRAQVGYWREHPRAAGRHLPPRRRGRRVRRRGSRLPRQACSAPWTRCCSPTGSPAA